MVPSGEYPWYDSPWLVSYMRALEVLERDVPEVREEFVETFASLRTRPDFSVQTLDGILDPAALDRVDQLVRSLRPTELLTYELTTFGRFVLGDDPTLAELHASIVDPVSECVGEPLEATYHFLSLYTGRGVCPLHMDAPKAKWTVDLCLRQSQPWPLWVSKVVPWPERAEDFEGDDWAVRVKADPANRFESFALTPGQAIAFSGSSQWHYRDRHPGGTADDFADFLFFHFTPRGMAAKLDPANWADLFGVPELADPLIVDGPSVVWGR